MFGIKVVHRMSFTVLLVAAVILVLLIVGGPGWLLLAYFGVVPEVFYTLPIDRREAIATFYIIIVFAVTLATIGSLWWYVQEGNELP